MILKVFIHSPIEEHQSFFQYFCYYKQCYFEHSCTYFLYIDVKISVGYVPQNVTAIMWATDIFNFAGCCQIVFQSSCTDLYFFWQCVRVPIAPCPCLHLVSSAFEMDGYEQTSQCFKNKN